jgi:hypothetical protein
MTYQYHLLPVCIGSCATYVTMLKALTYGEVGGGAIDVTKEKTDHAC